MRRTLPSVTMANLVIRSVAPSLFAIGEQAAHPCFGPEMANSPKIEGEGRPGRRPSRKWRAKTGGRDAVLRRNGGYARSGLTNLFGTD